MQQLNQSASLTSDMKYDYNDTLTLFSGAESSKVLRSFGYDIVVELLDETLKIKKNS